MKKWGFVLALALIAPCLMFFGCSLVYERAICKVDGVAYSTLAEAIEKCKEGGTVKVYNDVSASDGKLASATIDGKTYVQYIVDKAITIEGINQNYKKPKVYGSFLTNISSAEKTVVIKNLEIINDYCSLTSDAANTPFLYAIRVIDGPIEISKCTIHKARNIDSETLAAGDLTCIGGIYITRTTAQGEYYYNINENNIYGYSDGYAGSGCCAIKVQATSTDLMPYYFNPTTSISPVTCLTTQNSISSDSATLISIQSQTDGKYDYLTTSQANLIKSENFKEGSVVDFTGDTFGGDTVADFTVYGQMTFKAVKNIHFIMATDTASINITNRTNVTVDPYEG